MESLLGSKQFCVYFHYDSVANESEKSKFHLKSLCLMYNICEKKCYRLKRLILRYTQLNYHFWLKYLSLNEKLVPNINANKCTLYRVIMWHHFYPGYCYT